MGLPAHFTCMRRALASCALGDANRGARPLRICRGERSRRARCDDPPKQRASSYLMLPGARRLRAAAEPPLSRALNQARATMPAGWSARSSWPPRAGTAPGVERAVETVERALELYGAPVYVRKQIVHNLHVVRELEARGAIFVEDETDVPEGQTMVLSAHGVAPAVHANAEIRSLRTIDATCPLVTKVHVQAKRYAAEGYTVILIGHAGHEEVVGTDRKGVV